jgi:hypothetical protein
MRRERKRKRMKKRVRVEEREIDRRTNREIPKIHYTVIRVDDDL